MNRKITLLVVCLAVAALGLLGWRESSLSAKLTIIAVPTKSKITVNNQAARQGANKIRPGAKNITVSMDGFASVTQQIDIKRGENKDVDVVLVSNSARTANWYFTHPEDESKAEGISSKHYDALAQQALQKTPLIKLLPFVAGGLEFRVDYGNKPGVNNGLPVIFITAPTQQSQQNGLNWIRSVGFDPTAYKIEYVTGLVDPLNP